jgi:hypothetical protein
MKIDIFQVIIEGILAIICTPRSQAEFPGFEEPVDKKSEKILIAPTLFFHVVISTFLHRTHSPPKHIKGTYPLCFLIIS